MRQRYIDFLNRAPEQSGFDAWEGVLGRCPNAHDDAACDRVAVSGGFYRSQEFGGRGYFIYRLYDAALGRRPHYNEFVSDLAAFGLPSDEAALAEAKRRFAASFAQRAEFASQYERGAFRRSGLPAKLIGRRKAIDFPPDFA